MQRGNLGEGARIEMQMSVSRWYKPWLLSYPLYPFAFLFPFSLKFSSIAMRPPYRDYLLA